MDTFVVTKQNAVIDQFHPDIIKCVCFNSKDAKRVCSLFNKEHETNRKDPELRKQFTYLKKKLARYEEILKENDLMPKPGRKPGKNKAPRVYQRKGFATKTCPGFHCDPHPFVPRSGAQTMCRECRERQKNAIRLRGKEAANQSKWMTKKTLTPEEILKITDPEQRQREYDKLSPAEQQQYMILQTKRQRESWKLQRTKSFRLDDPIMGTEAGPVQ